MLILRLAMRMEIKSISKKQAQILTWWIENSKYDSIVRDGAIRSGKTIFPGIYSTIWFLGDENGN